MAKKKKTTSAGDYDAVFTAAWEAVEAFYPDDAKVTVAQEVEGGTASVLKELAGEALFKAQVNNFFASEKITADGKKIEKLQELTASLANEKNKEAIAKAPKTVAELFDTAKKAAAEAAIKSIEAEFALLKAEHVDGKAGEALSSENKAVEAADNASDQIAILDSEKQPQYSFASADYTKLCDEVDKEVRARSSLKWAKEQLAGANKEAALDEVPEGAITKPVDISKAIIAEIQKQGKDGDTELDKNLLPPQAEITYLMGSLTKDEFYASKKAVETIADAYLKALDGKKENLEAAKQTMAESMLKEVTIAKTPKNIIGFAKGYDDVIIQGKSSKVGSFVDHVGANNLKYAAAGVALMGGGLMMKRQSNPENPDEEKMGFLKKAAITVGSVVLLGAAASMLYNRHQGKTAATGFGRQP